METKSLDGLRGLCCLHVMVSALSDLGYIGHQVYHYLMHIPGCQLCGSMEMPLFYLLSG